MTDSTLDPIAEQALLARMGDLLTRAALLRVMAMAFAYPQSGHHGVVQQQLGALHDLSSTAVSEAFYAFRKQWADVDPEGLQVDHCRLFQGRNVVSLHETSYGDARRIGGQVVELSDINGFYRAFGMQLSEANPEMPDHLCTELEFYSLLLVKQAYALDNDWVEEEAVTADASRKFLEAHLGRWIAPMLAGLRENGDNTLYVALGELLLLVVEEECRLQEVTPQPFAGPFPMDLDIHADQFTCPMAGEGGAKAACGSGSGSCVTDPVPDA